MNKNETLITILVGGFGTRIKHLLFDTPKPLAVFHGKPFIYWIIIYYYKRGYKNFALACHFNVSKFFQFVEMIDLKDINIQIVYEHEPLGTFGAFINVFKSYVNQSENFLNYIVINGDSFINYDIDNFIKISALLDFCIVAVKNKDTSRYGSITMDDNMNLLKFEEKVNGNGFMNAGIYYVSNSLLKRKNFCLERQSFEYDLIPNLLNDNETVKVFPVDSDFIDIGTDFSFKRANSFVHNYIIEKN